MALPALSDGSENWTIKARDARRMTVAEMKYMRKTAGYILPGHKTNTEVKVKCTLLQALRFGTGRTTHRGSRGIDLLFFDYGTRKGWGVSVTPRPLFTPGKEPVPIVQEAGWAPGPVWTGAENLVPTGIRFPDRPARSQSLYRLSYPAHNKHRDCKRNKCNRVQNL